MVCHLLGEVAPKKAGSLCRIMWFNLHCNCISPFGSVYWLVIQLHAGNPADLNAALAGDAYWSSHLDTEACHFLSKKHCSRIGLDS